MFVVLVAGLSGRRVGALFITIDYSSARTRWDPNGKERKHLSVTAWIKKNLLVRTKSSVPNNILCMRAPLRYLFYFEQNFGFEFVRVEF